MPHIAFFIPTLGTRFLLSQPLEFDLYVESRNDSFFEALGYTHSRRWIHYPKEIPQLPLLNPMIEVGDWQHIEEHIPGVGCGWTHRELKKRMRLPIGTVLTLDRIYIRKGSEGYNSVSFNLLYCPVASFCPRNGFKNMGGSKATTPLIKGDKGRIRFWAKLEDVNNNLVFDDTFKGDFLP